MHKCPKCKNGKMTVLLVNENKHIELTCIHCHGTGQVTQDVLEDIQEADRFMKEEMCSCDNPTFGSYPEDGQCHCGMQKHHVHCGTCEKISQIG